MKEEVQDKLVEIMTSIQSAVGAASDFAIEQLPDIAQSYIMYGMVWNTALLVVHVVIVAFSIVLIYRGIAILQRKNWADSGIALVILGGFCAAVSGLTALPTLQTTLLVWFAPKVWLLKELATLIR
jgi:hypothetical protein